LSNYQYTTGPRMGELESPTYFLFLDESWDWLYVKVAVRKARIQREFQRLQEHVLA
jgi:hypothetical protein